MAGGLPFFSVKKKITEATQGLTIRQQSCRCSEWQLSAREGLGVVQWWQNVVFHGLEWRKLSCLEVKSTTLLQNHKVWWLLNSRVLIWDGVISFSWGRKTLACSVSRHIYSKQFVSSSIDFLRFRIQPNLFKVLTVCITLLEFERTVSSIRDGAYLLVNTWVWKMEEDGGRVFLDSNYDVKSLHI